MTAPNSTHEHIVDNLVKRLQDKHDFVRKENRFFVGERCAGSMDVGTVDWHHGKTYIHCYEVKTGNYAQARHKARQQFHAFIDAYKHRKEVVPTFIFYHPEHGFERWKP